jgi:hypothetical protein
MATSNSGPQSERTPLGVIVLSLVFLLITVIAIVWVIRPATLGYNNAPYTDNPTPITVTR